ncbi:WecB/TagA/CpsF family glycosyltransferase [Candidatus Uhrbacteria bacterium]|nr:WecB/TagA/CpsF family glycosyltransferase [Candidatus Uhrbacteria bacterium]
MSVEIIGVRIDRLRSADIRERCAEWLLQKERRRLHQVVTVNPEFIMEAQRNSEFRKALNAAALSLADGIGLFFASWILYGWRSRLFRVTGVDFTWMLAELCAQNGSRVYLLGAGDGLAHAAAAVLQRRYPTLVIAGAEMGIPKVVAKTSDLLDKELCEKICSARPDVLLVAFGAPRQDLWIAHNASRMDGIAIAVGVGGTFDYLAGAVPYAPKWVRSIGFEWTYRLMTQPYRWRRIITAVIRFPIAVLRSKFF